MAAASALWSLRPLPFDRTYVWALTTSLPAVLTPALGADDRYPSVLWHYFLTHSDVVLAAVFLAFGLGLTARRHAVRRVFLATAAWAAPRPSGTPSPAATTCSYGSDR